MSEEIKDEVKKDYKATVQIYLNEENAKGWMRKVIDGIHEENDIKDKKELASINKKIKATEYAMILWVGLSVIVAFYCGYIFGGG